MERGGRASRESSREPARDARAGGTRARKARADAPEAAGAEEGARDGRRKQILQAAARVFADRGYHGARISDVAEEAGVAYGLVYHYFGNKEGLLREIFESNWRFFAKAIEQIATVDASSQEKLRQIVEFIVNAFEVAPYVVKVLVLEFGRSSRLGDALDEPDVNRVFRAVFSIFKDASRRGELDAACDPWALTVLFLGALESTLASFVFPAHGEASHVLANRLVATRDTLVATFTRGLFPTRDGEASTP